MKVALLAASIVLLPSIAQARTWYTLGTDNNGECVNMRQLSAELGRHVSSPKHYIELTHAQGYTTAVTAKIMDNGEIGVVVMLYKNGALRRVQQFANSPEGCKNAVDVLLQDGRNVPLDQLR